MERNEIKKEFEKNLDCFTADLKGLIEIPSIAVEAQGEYPFGSNVQRALEYMLNLGSAMGFETKNIDNYGAHIDFPGTEEGVMAIVGHIDVVPEGDGWDHDPFSGKVVDGWMYGRGTQDDKGPTMVGLYVMKVLKDLGFRPKKTIRLILGLDEEASWDGMKYYLEHEKAPDFGIVPDADFPLVQCEKGLLEFDLLKLNTGAASASGERSCVLESMEGGVAPNVVAGQASFRIVGSEVALARTEKIIVERATERNYEIKSRMEDQALLVDVTGRTAHAALPERGKNAISMAMDLLGGLLFANEDANKLVEFYNDRIGFALDGSKIGCAMADDLSGDLSFNVGKIRFDAEEARITIDIRYPVTKSQQEVCDKMMPLINESGYRLEVFDHIRAIYQESDHPVVQTLLEVYRDVTGDLDSKPSVIGGATFARAIPNCMAYGVLFPGDPELEHQKNEAVQLSQLLKAGQIYAEAVYRLTK